MTRPFHVVRVVQLGHAQGREHLLMQTARVLEPAARVGVVVIADRRPWQSQCITLIDGGDVRLSDAGSCSVIVASAVWRVVS